MTQLKRHSRTFPLVRQTLLAASVIAAVCSASTLAAAATVTDLKAVHRNGQTFITFTENSGAGEKTTYDVYRHTLPIASVSGLTKIATLDADSGRLLYDDNPRISLGTGQNLTTGLIISDLGPHLAANKGLLVWTTAASGCFYYAVTNSVDAAVNPGINSLTSCVNEMHQAVPGAIRISGPTTAGNHNVSYYMAWEDYSTWNMSEWGYYGHLFSVSTPASGIAAPYPLLLQLHSAGGTQYLQPPNGTDQDAISGVVIQPVDMDWTGFTEPYTGRSMGNSVWSVRFDTSDDVYRTCTEDRIVRYVKLVRDNASGDGFDFQIDSTRVYAYGLSLGSGAMHLVSHYPDVFAAGMTSVGWLDNASYGNFSNAGKHVNSGSGPTLTDYLDMAYYAATTAIRPMIYTFGSYDGTIKPTSYTAALALFETYHQPFYAEWKDQDHLPFAPTASQWNHHNAGSGYLRFRLTEAYPAFGNASTSTPIPTFPGHFAGQRNGNLDWGSELHPVGAAIEDSVRSFGITLKSVSVDTSANVTIRNAQQFLPEAGQRVEWRNESQTGQLLQSGSVVADAQGLVTVRLQVTAGGNRLTLSCGSCTASAAAKVPMPPSNVRIVRP